MSKILIMIAVTLSIAGCVCAEESEPSSLRLGYNIPRGFISKENGTNCKLTCEPIIRTEKYGFENLPDDKERFGFPEDLIRSYAFIPIPAVFTSHFRFIMNK